MTTLADQFYQWVNTSIRHMKFNLHFGTPCSSGVLGLAAKVHL